MFILLWIPCSPGFEVRIYRPLDELMNWWKSSAVWLMNWWTDEKSSGVWLMNWWTDEKVQLCYLMNWWTDEQNWWIDEKVQVCYLMNWWTDEQNWWIDEVLLWKLMNWWKLTKTHVFWTISKDSSLYKFTKIQRFLDISHIALKTKLWGKYVFLYAKLE